MSQPIERTASAEIIQPQVPPLPVVVISLHDPDGSPIWGAQKCGTREECNEFVRRFPRTLFAILTPTLTPPAPVRTAASEAEVDAAYEAAYGETGYLGYLDAFRKGVRAAERHHGITKETADAE